MLEPAGEIAGDSFDFSIERDTLHLSMSDARGHAVGASVLATLLVGALRNARRAGVDLAQHARLANDGLGDFVRWSDFVSWRCDRATGSCSSRTAWSSATPRTSTSGR